MAQPPHVGCYLDDEISGLASPPPGCRVRFSGIDEFEPTHVGCYSFDEVRGPQSPQGRVSFHTLPSRRTSRPGCGCRRRCPHGPRAARILSRAGSLTEYSCGPRSSGSGLGFGRAAGKRFCQSNELSHFTDFFRKRFACELFPHLQFHNVGSFSLCRCRIFSNCVLSSPDCWSICSMRALSLARPTLAAMATMCSARKIFAATPS